MSRRSQIASKSILEAYVSLNSTFGTIWARFGPQNGSQTEVQNRSKIDVDGDPRPNPSPKAIVEAAETSPDLFSRALRSGVFIIYSYLQATWATCKQLQVAIIVHYRAGSHYHRRGSSFRSDSGMFALQQSILESWIPVFSFPNPLCQRFLFG